MQHYFLSLAVMALAANGQTFFYARTEPFGNPVVTGKPFSSTEERHTVQVLANGTRIENTQTNRLYRDTEGRTRVENMNGTVSVFDPVAQLRVELNPKDKTARKGFAAQALGTLASDVPLAVEAQRRALEATARALEERRAVTGASAGSSEATENLGTQMINGVWAQGTRTTVTIPKGQIGNDREIKVVTERWFSSDLNMLVKSVNSDPRFGDTTYQLTKVLLTSPDPTLFQIPPDYTVTGPGAARGGRSGGGRGGRGGRDN